MIITTSDITHILLFIGIMLLFFIMRSLHRIEDKIGGIKRK